MCFSISANLIECAHIHWTGWTIIIHHVSIETSWIQGVFVLALHDKAFKKVWKLLPNS
jgi:hypothetical protein